MLKHHLSLTLTTAALLLGTPIIAHAEAEPSPSTETKSYEAKDKKFLKFEEADTNKDGALTKEEMLEAHKKRIDAMFERLDTDKNGTLSKAELDKGRDEMHKKMKERWKENHDRKSDKNSTNGVGSE
jgi:hypothetical protein